jgi:gliding motility-associated-like protein
VLALQSLAFAQVNVTPSSSATALAQAIAGSGVTVSNAAINCGNSAAGTFTYNGSNLGLSGGILLTTGTSVDVANPGSYLCNVNNGNNVSDPNLTSIVPSANLDACILQFDFVPVCSSLNMTYVFGSEEYPQAVNLQYNDAFAIFLTGPNPSGGNYSAQNIATLPNGTPVSIHNVNAGNNSSYFHNNYSSPNNDIAYNGYTIPVTSTTPVVPCSTYHMKIAIADAGNALYDSGVFLKDNGISCQNAPVLSVSTTPTSCSNSGSATVSVSNYTGTPTYHWIPGGQTTATISNQSAGTYTCTVHCQQACGVLTQTITATISTAGNNMVLTSSQQTLTCNGASNASSTVSVAGGIAPYTCVWNTNPVQTGFTATNLSAGTYSAIVTDNSGCQSTIQVHITAPPAMQLQVATTSATCTGATGTASVSVTNNGTAPFSYSWNSTPPQNSQNATNLTHGQYTVTVTDAHSCSVAAVATVGTQNSTWTLSSSVTNAACNGSPRGTATVNINNPGNSSFTYSWNTTPPQSSQSASNLSVGAYTCTVIDNNGCSAATVATVGIQNPTWTLSSSVTNVACYGGTGGAASVSVNNPGNSSFTYSWNTTPPQSSQSVSNLPAGVYTCTVTDNNGCVILTTASVSQPAILTASVTTSPTMCQGSVGSAAITPVGGTQPYSYVWSSMPLQTTAIAQGLGPGQYTITITDAHNCSTSALAAVGTVNPTLQITDAVHNSICGGPSGSISILSVTPGYPPLSYSWYTGQNTAVITNLMPGTYQVNVTDKNGCAGSAAITVGIDPNMPIQTSASPDVCNQSKGSASVNVTGNPPYQYVWSTNPVQTTQMASNLPAGNYYVTVTDAYNCKDSSLVTVINQNDAFSPVMQSNPGLQEISSEDPVSINVTVNPGWSLTQAYLSDGTIINSLGFNHIFNHAGDYTAAYYFTSLNGCKDSVIYEIHVKDEMTLYIPNSFSPNFDGVNDSFGAKGSLVNSFEMYIYDRWDNLVAKLENINESWDGKFKGQEAPVDTYVYRGKATDAYGKEINFSGQINLIR